MASKRRPSSRKTIAVSVPWHRKSWVRKSLIPAALLLGLGATLLHSGSESRFARQLEDANRDPARIVRQWDRQMQLFVDSRQRNIIAYPSDKAPMAGLQLQDVSDVLSREKAHVGRAFDSRVFHTPLDLVYFSLKPDAPDGKHLAGTLGHEIAVPLAYYAQPVLRDHFLPHEIAHYVYTLPNHRQREAFCNQAVALSKPHLLKEADHGNPLFNAHAAMLLERHRTLSGLEGLPEPENARQRAKQIRQLANALVTSENDLVSGPIGRVFRQTALHYQANPSFFDAVARRFSVQPMDVVVAGFVPNRHVKPDDVQRVDAIAQKSKPLSDQQLEDGEFDLKRDVVRSLKVQGTPSSHAEELYYAWASRKFWNGKELNYSSIPPEDILSEARKGLGDLNREIAAMTANVQRLPPDRAQLLQGRLNALMAEASYLRGITDSGRFIPRYFGSP
ncbi:hypothetical protein HYV43_03930 [Candidatus Micrarchaeota archaeon]|nr:hypothetical protein [Candidatus Micrarchaeota archaeon]